MNSLNWSIKMTDTVIDDNCSYKKKWCYEFGLVLKAMETLWLKTKDQKYFDYIKKSTDEFVNTDGNINTYKINEYNIDQICMGKILFLLYKETKDDKYKKAAALLMEQLKTHPRTSEGGFWHKKIYPNQMWLDGLYMCTPFYAQFAKEFDKPEIFDDAANQILLVEKHTKDSKTGLLFHGWDESKQQKWSDPVTGCSPNFWGRAMGWYVMAIVDFLDFLPEEHSKRESIVTILNNLVLALVKYQDPKTGLWYQMVDQMEREGNYLETSASSMFVYGIAKAAKNGLIDKSYMEIAKKGYEGIRENFIEEDDIGRLLLKGICGVAGLGGNPYRDGSYEYYISEPIIENDYKGVGPFIMAGIEIEN